MKKTLLKCVSVGWALCCAPALMAQTQTPLHLPAIFSDGMVLQQQSSVPVWGWGEASTTVKIVGSWMPEDTVTAQVDDCGRWKTEISTTRYGGPYTLHIFSDNMPGNRIELKDVLLGEVWLCSGQSNMEWSPKNGIQNQNNEIASADHPTIRYFSLNKRGSDYLQEDCIAQWETCSPDVMRRRSAVAYFFGKRLKEELKVPVGLIVSAWGGTPAEVWAPREVVMGTPEIANAMLDKTYPWWPVAPGVLYNSMIFPLMPYEIAGAIWYQGESNRENPSSYYVLMQKMIESWRKGFGKEFPFYLVQIAPFKYGATDNGPALIREAQDRVAREVPNTGMVVTVDVGDPGNIHPAKKVEVGTRLANLALGRHYKVLEKGYESPLFERMEIEKGKAIVTFTQTESGLVCPDKTINGVQIAGEDGAFVPAKAEIRENRLVVSSPEVKSPVAVRYCFDDATIGNLFNGDGMPVAPFRTDVAK